MFTASCTNEQIKNKISGNEVLGDLGLAQQFGLPLTGATCDSGYSQLLLSDPECNSSLSAWCNCEGLISVGCRAALDSHCGNSHDLCSTCVAKNNVLLSQAGCTKQDLTAYCKSPCRAALDAQCHGARNASVGNCLVCTGQRAEQLKQAGCLQADMDGYCTNGTIGDPNPPFCTDKGGGDWDILTPQCDNDAQQQLTDSCSKFLNYNDIEYTSENAIKHCLVNPSDITSKFPAGGVAASCFKGNTSDKHWCLSAYPKMYNCAGAKSPFPKMAHDILQCDYDSTGKTYNNKMDGSAFPSYCNWYCLAGKNCVACDSGLEKGTGGRACPGYSGTPVYPTLEECRKSGCGH